MGLNVSWSKTKIQCLDRSAVRCSREGSGCWICYLGSVQDSNVRSGPDILRRLGFTAIAMGCVWTQKNLSLGTKLRIYHTCILPIALSSLKRLQAFHRRCQRRIRWNPGHQVAGHGTQHHGDWKARGLPPVNHIINTRRCALFGHMVRLVKQTPAHRALKLAVDARCGCPLSQYWRRPWCRVHDTWLQPLMRSGTSIQLQWDRVSMEVKNQDGCLMVSLSMGVTTSLTGCVWRSILDFRSPNHTSN